MPVLQEFEVDSLREDEILAADDPGFHSSELDRLPASKLDLPIFRAFSNDQIDLMLVPRCIRLNSLWGATAE